MTAAPDGDRAVAARAVETWVAEACAAEGVTSDLGARPGEYVVQLPGEHKLRTTVSLLLGDHGLSLSAFVVRHPDENEAGLHRWLLRRNTKLRQVAFAVDGSGDVFLVGRLPLVGVTTHTLDDVMGEMLGVADSSFDELLSLGFAASIRREWAWRTSRGESTSNLEAFRHLVRHEPVPDPRTIPGG